MFVRTMFDVSNGARLWKRRASPMFTPRLGGRCPPSPPPPKKEFFFYLQRCPSQKKFLFWRLFGKAEKFFFGWHNCPLRRRCAAADYIAGVSGFAASNVPLTTFLDNEKIKIVVKKQIGIATLKESV